MDLMSVRRKLSVLNHMPIRPDVVASSTQLSLDIMYQWHIKSIRALSRALCA
jgi:hypothetical protein